MKFACFPVALFVALALPHFADATGCAPIALGAPRRWQVSAADGVELTIKFLGHASFLTESPRGVTPVTDYNGANVPEIPPDIATR